jgi:hypothetical protein
LYFGEEITHKTPGNRTFSIPGKNWPLRDAYAAGENCLVDPLPIAWRDRHFQATARFGVR